MHKHNFNLHNIFFPLFALIIIFASVFAGSFPISGQGDDLLSQIDKYITEQMAQQHIVGLSVAVVQGKEVTYLKGFGRASIEKQTEVTPQTIFDLASCSKSFTAMAVVLLVEDGLIDLDQTLVHYIPEFEMEDKEVSDLITVRQLLNQTSGIPGNMYEPLAFQREENTQNSDPFDLLVEVMKRIETDREPGSSFEYTNLNYCLLGALVERVSGIPFEDFVQERIFTPLRMVNSTLKPEEADDGDRADGHQMMLGKIITKNVPVYRSAAPAGWVMSSAQDLSSWLLINLHNGEINNQQIIPSDVVIQMQTPSLELTQNGDHASYGMGWFIGETGEGETVIWHGGDTPNFLAEMIILPEQDLGIAMLVNSQTSRNAHSVALGIADILTSSTIELPTSPWWASWAAIDRIATYAFLATLILICGLIPYLWWQWRIIRRYIKREYTPPSRGRKMRIWHWVLPATPWVFLGIIAGAAFIVAQTIFGFNLFITIIRFGDFSPPGVLISAYTLICSLVLWALALTISGFVRAYARGRAERKSI
jgi:CubicO group peptidase (beta-lactamase class C family)